MFRIGKKTGKTGRIRSTPILVPFLAGAIWLVGGAAPPTASAAEDGFNACGCRQGSAGMCICEKKSKCGCPGECEPKGCEERRAKQIEKEIQAETKKAEEAGRRQRARDSDESSSPVRRENDGATTRGENAKAPHKGKTVKMTAAQRRDLAKLIGAYLAEHPDQGGKAIDQVKAEVSRK